MPDQTQIINPFNKEGIISTPYSADELITLNNKPQFNQVMDWVENCMNYTKMIVSPEFFHPTFTKKERDIIVSIIWSVYPNVSDIQPFGENGIFIQCSDFLDVKKALKTMNNYFKHKVKK